MTRFVVDESSWSDTPADALPLAFERLLERLRATRERAEPVRKCSAIYETMVAGQVPLYDVLWSPDCPFLGRDLRLRLQVALDQIADWDRDHQIGDITVSVAGRTFEAASIAFAWDQAGARKAIACLPLDCVGRQGTIPVVIAGTERSVHFVTTDAEHVEFFRSAIAFENVSEHDFEELAASAFPRLHWADDVWSGLAAFSRPFRDMREAVVRHLSVLNDDAADLFGALLTTHPDEIGPRLSACGADASDENGRTKRNRQCELDRTRLYNGRQYIFWWHSKLQPHVDRIHFYYQRGREGESGFIIIGIFTDHCRLPN